MENETVVTAEVEKSETHEKKVRKHSDTRRLAGAITLKKKMDEVMKVHAEIQSHSEVVKKVAESLNISEQKAFEMLKNPDGIADVQKLASYIRSATLRNDVALNAVTLCRIAQVIAENIPDSDMLIPRENQKAVTENDGK